MAPTASITTEQPYDKMRQLFAAELARTHERSTITLNNKDGRAAFDVKAKDTPALRAALNTITSVLAIHEKTTEAIHGRTEEER
jgi:tRNA threonylcarbamoyladenosine modification (KEOPS) complex  Pcc1 subunit